MNADPEQLAEAADATGRVIAAITDEQWTLPTPCTEWNVRQLVEHIVTGNAGFVAALGNQRPELSAGADLSLVYRQSARSLIEASRAPDVLQQMVTVPFGTVPGAVALHLRTTELLVHGWDLARAIGAQVTFPEAIAELELAFTRAALEDVPADHKAFEPPQPVAADAPAIDRLAACLGRTIS
jgi:uncharacterized protein (TIGR03086 family)